MITVEHLPLFGAALKELRWHARLKQVEICRATKLTAPQVSRYENGREMPTVESLVKYLHAVGADLADLQRALDALTTPRGSDPSDRRQEATGAAVAGGRLEALREAGDQRLESSAGLRQMLGGLMHLNLEGMERIEHRMQSLEERLEQIDRAGRQGKSGA